jgi:hypothetical protein
MSFSFLLNAHYQMHLSSLSSNKTKQSKAELYFFPLIDFEHMPIIDRMCAVKIEAYTKQSRKKLKKKIFELIFLTKR